LKSIKVSDYFQILKPEYVYVKITPIKSIRNYKSDEIARAVNIMFKETKRQIEIQFRERKVFYKVQPKLSYYIYIEYKRTEFYFIIPKEYYILFKEKISNTWKGITITKVNELPQFTDQATKFKLTYTKEDAMSLSTDKRANTLLGSLLNMTTILQEGDRIGIFYNFIPTCQNGWISSWDRTIKSYKENFPIDKQKVNVKYILKIILNLFVETANTIFNTLGEVFDGSQSEKTNFLPVLYQEKLIDPSTKNKRESVVIQTQILTLSESPNKKQQENNAYALADKFNIINGDNTLKSKNYYEKVDFNMNVLKGIEPLSCSADECQSYLALPARDLLETYNNSIEHLDVIETEIPSELQTGYISLGNNMFRGKQTEGFLRDDKYYASMPLVILGSQGSGKTTYMGNYVKYAQSRNEGVICIDFIKNCELTDTIKTYVSKDKIIEIDMSNMDHLQGIGYNELKPKNPNNATERLQIANRKALYISMLIDSLNNTGEPLTSPMERYLSAASNIVMLNENASLRDVIRCLENWEQRHKYINNIPNELKEILEDEITALKELDEKQDKGDNKGDVIGTRLSKIEGIQHRINLLKKDLTLKMMFNHSLEGNLDLVQAMEDGKIVLIKIPQDKFPTPYVKNVIVCYLFSKAWVTALIRGSMHEYPKRCHIIVDEIFQAPTAMNLLREQEILPQCRKFNNRFIFSAQYLGQVSKINDTLKAAGSSYMFLKGSSIDFNSFHNELLPYTIEDMEALPQYHSLNLVNFEKGRAKFITKLPKP
jgi:Ni2+-binding GTPase involved in maturation of urease and hydrogenase